MAEAAMATETTEVPAALAGVSTEEANLIDTSAVQSTEEIVPVRPDHVDDMRDAEIKSEADAIVAAILENPSDLDATSRIYGLGADAKSANTDNISLVEQKIAPVMGEIGTESAVGKSFMQIKAQLDLVNPHVVGQEEVEAPASGFFNKMLRKTTNVVVSSLPGGNEKIMVMINERRDTVKSTVSALKEHLWTERDKALKNAIELGQVANQLADAQDAMLEATYLGQLIWEGLNAARQTETDPVRKQSLDYLTTDLGMAVVDLQTIDQLNIQSRMGAETLIKNCRGIQQLVGRVTDILLPSVQTALAVKAAAAQQASLAQHSRDIMAASGEVIAQTAQDIGRVSVDVARMNTEAMVDLDKLAEAAAAYEQAQAQLDTIMAEAEMNARGISNRMAALNERMRDKADPMTRARRAQEKAGV